MVNQSYQSTKGSESGFASMGFPEKPHFKIDNEHFDDYILRSLSDEEKILRDRIAAPNDFIPFTTVKWPRVGSSGELGDSQNAGDSTNRGNHNLNNSNESQATAKLFNSGRIQHELDSAESAPVQQAQSEPRFMNDRTQLFANIVNSNIAGVSQAEGYSERDMHQTVNNDNSTENDFINNYTGATRYNGAHNDHRQRVVVYTKYMFVITCCIISFISSSSGPDTSMSLD
ncbi:hypothetical protein FB446DRAFT_743453 [Lentinula raphanica]|nr:hypothetical protein FB446DRAFT_743453 [Lentinula raphanica]